MILTFDLALTFDLHLFRKLVLFRIDSLRAFDRRLARLSPPVSPGVRQGAELVPLTLPAGRIWLDTPVGRGLNEMSNDAFYIFKSEKL